MIFRKGMSTENPSTIDWKEDENIIYIRKNITSQVIDGARFYYYDEYKYTQEEFISTNFEQLRADLDYISMMAEVDL